MGSGKGKGAGSDSVVHIPSAAKAEGKTEFSAYLFYTWCERGLVGGWGRARSAPRSGGLRPPHAPPRAAARCCSS